MMMLSWRQTTVSMTVSVLLGGVLASGAGAALSLPQGHCADPQPMTDLRHCDFRGADLRNKDLRGADMRGSNAEAAQLEGAVLTDTIFDGTDLLLGQVTGVPTEVEAIKEHAYRVALSKKGRVTLSLVPEGDEGSREDVVTLNHPAMAQPVAGTTSIVAMFFTRKPLTDPFLRDSNLVGITPLFVHKGLIS